MTKPPGKTGDDRTLDQKRAAHALERVNKVLGQEHATQYRAYARGLPMTVRTAGLGQALAMEYAAAGPSQKAVDRKSKEELAHGLLYDHIRDWLTAERGWPHSPYRQGNDHLIKKLIDGSEPQMVRAQFETMAYLKWLKTFAEALIPKPEGGDA